MPNEEIQNVETQKGTDAPVANRGDRIGGRGGNLGYTESKDQVIEGLNDAVSDIVGGGEHEPAPEPPTQDMPEETPTDSNVLTYTGPDGSERELVLPDDPEEAAKLIGSLASGRDAYLEGKKKLNDISPELGGVFRDILKERDEVWKQTLEQYKPKETEPPVDDLGTLFTPEDKHAYGAMIDKLESIGMEHKDAEATADAWWTSLGAERLKRRELEGEITTIKQTIVQDKQEQLLQSNINKIRSLEKDLPDPNRDINAFQRKFREGYGGWLTGEFGIPEELIYISKDINHDKLHRLYLLETGRSSDEGAMTAAKAGKGKPSKLSPKTAETIRNLSAGGTSASIGKDLDWESFRKKTPKDRRKTADRDPRYSDNIIKGLGLDKFFRK